MSGKIETNKITASTSAQYALMGDRDWVEISNTGSEDVYGRYDADASSSDWDFKIVAGATKTWDRGCGNRISVATSSSTSVITVESI